MVATNTNSNPSKYKDKVDSIEIAGDHKDRPYKTQKCLESLPRRGKIWVEKRCNYIRYGAP